MLLPTLIKSHSIPSFGSTHLLRGSRQRDILPNEKNGTRIVIQMDFVENFTTKINCLGKSVYWAYNQVTFCTACVWTRGGTHSIVIVSYCLQYGKYATNVFLKNHSATSRFNCPPVSGSCHLFRWCHKSI